MCGHVWSCMVTYYGLAWSCLVTYGNVRSCMVMCGHVWSYMVGLAMQSHVWSCMVIYTVMYGHLWSCKVRYGPKQNYNTTQDFQMYALKLKE